MAPVDKDKILVFENKDFGSIRTVMIDGAPWFVATDVCADRKSVV